MSETTPRPIDYDHFRSVRRELGEASELLSAINMLSPLNLASFLRHLEDIITKIDSRLGQLEKRIDEAKIPEAVIDDDEAEKYFTLPAVWGWGA